MAKQHAQRWAPTQKGTRAASPGMPLNGVDAAISDWAANRCCETLRKQKPVADPQWVLTSRVADGRATVTAWLAAMGFQDPDLNEDLGMRSSQFPVDFFQCDKQRNLWTLGAKNASLRADTFDRVVYLRAPRERDPCAPE